MSKLNSIQWQYRHVTPKEIVSCLNEMIDLYDEVVENGQATFKNSEIYRNDAGICENLTKCMYQNRTIKFLPKQYRDAVKKWMDKQNIEDSSYWLGGYDEYEKSNGHRMANPKRLEAMIFIRDELLKGD